MNLKSSLSSSAPQAVSSFEKIGSGTGIRFPFPNITIVATDRVLENFWRRVEKTDGCWLWTGSLGKDGYGRYSIKGGTWRAAHRFAWYIENGPIPSGMQVCHRCDTPACVRASHLFLGTAADNQHDKVAKRRQATGAAHGAAVLTAEQVAQIRGLASYGTTATLLARRYGVTPQSIRNILQGRTWRAS